MIKYYDKGHLKEIELILAHSSDVQFMMVGKSVWQELEATGYILSRTEQGEMNAGMFAFSVL